MKENQEVTLQEFKNEYFDDDTPLKDVEREYNIYIKGMFGGNI